MARGRKRGSTKERLIQKQEEAKVMAKEVKKKGRPKKGPKSRKELLAHAEKLKAELARTQVLVLEKDHPELSGLRERLEVAEKDANSFPRLIKLRKNRIATAESQLDDLRISLVDLELAQESAMASVAEIQQEIDKIRQDIDSKL